MNSTQPLTNVHSLEALVASSPQLQGLADKARREDCLSAAVLVDELVRLIELSDAARKCAVDRWSEVVPILGALMFDSPADLRTVLDTWSRRRMVDGKPSLFAGTLREQEVEQTWLLMRLVRQLQPRMRDEENAAQTLGRCLGELDSLYQALLEFQEHGLPAQLLSTASHHERSRVLAWITDWWHDHVLPLAEPVLKRMMARSATPVETPRLIPVWATSEAVGSATISVQHPSVSSPATH